MNKEKSVPGLRYNIVTHSRPLYGFITLGEDKIHKIANVDEFYKALGYSDEAKNNGLLAEEYLWEEYRKDRSKLSPTCLQARLIGYLRMNSPTFNIHDGPYGNWICGCRETSMQKELGCNACLMHPSHDGT